MPKEKNSASFAISSAVSAPRGTSIMVPTRYSTPDAVLAQHLLGRLEHDLLLPPQLLDVADQRDHDLGLDRDALLRHLQRGLEDGARLHARDLGIGDAQPAAAVAEHGVELVQLLHRAQQLLETLRDLRAWFFASPLAAQRGDLRPSAPRAWAGTRAAAGRGCGW